MIREECRKIYREAFMDEDKTFENLLFDVCKNSLKILNAENEIVSMLFLLPCILKNDSERINAFYLYAAATGQNHRKKGYMEKLIKKALEDCDLVFLRPANERLCDYYKKLGFKKISANSDDALFSLQPQGCYEKLVNITGINDFKEVFNVMYYSKNKIEINNILFNYSMN